MQITPKARLAVAAMLELALHRTRGPIAITAMQSRLRMAPALSLATLEQLFTRLRRHGMVYSTRGPGGGYGLAHSAADITVADIMLAISRPHVPDAHPTDLLPGVSPRPSQRLTSDWPTELECTITEFLASVSLQDLITQGKLVAPQEPMRAPVVVKSGVGKRSPMVVMAANSVFTAPRCLVL